MTDRIETEALQAARVVRDTLGAHGDLYMRLMGFYRVGPDGPVEPEFGYRDFSDSDLRQPIQNEAAAALAAMATKLAAETAKIERLRAAIAPFESAAQIFDQNGNFVGGEGGECLCGFITGKHLIEAARARAGA